jgi:hypothetical protein
MWWRRTARRMPWSRAPLRRGSDKVQAWLTLTGIVMTLMVAPWAAWWAASTTYLAEVRASAWERQAHRPVTAVLVQDAHRRLHDDDGEAPRASANVPVPARWPGPDGAVRSGTVSVAVGTRTGTLVTVWVDGNGTLVPPPRRRNPTVDASVAAMLAVAALTAFLGGVRRIVVWCLDRRRLRSWEAEWLIVGPRWSGR